jgi:hypothetical protein
MTVIEARAMADDLAAKVAALKLAMVALDEQRAEISLFALGDGNAEAQRRLGQLHKERVARQLALEDLEVALAAAKRRVAEVELRRPEREKADREKARKAEPIVKRLAERGAVMDAALKTYVENFVGTQRNIDQLIAMGLPMTTRALILTNMENAHDAAMFAFGNRNARPVRVRRRTFTELVESWCVPPRNWISARLNITAAKDAA